MSERKLVPKRRFKGFSGDWEEKKLGEIVAIVGGGTPSTEVKEYWNGDVNWYSPVEIGTTIYTYGSQKKITQLGLEKSSAKVLPKDITILFTSRAGIGDMAILKCNAATNQGFQSFVVDDRIYVYFLYSYGYEIKKFALKNASGSTFLEISGKQLGEMPINIPSIEEQTKIGDFFKQLDNLIRQQQKKLDKLKALKQAYLFEMFPSDGEKVPKRRFKGFSGDWEEKKLGDIAEFRRGSFPQPYGEQKWYDNKNGMPFIQVVDVDINLKLVDNSKQKISSLAQPFSVFVESDKILVTLQGSIGRVAITQYPSYVDRTILIFEIFLVSIFEYFFAYTIQMLFDKEKKIAPGGTIKTITKDVLTKFQVLLPSIQEQTAIGNFFKHLDDQINHQQRKLAKLQDLKKAYLNEMFV